jgi:hypothetical protein
MESVWGPELVQTRYKILQEVNKTHMSKWNTNTYRQKYMLLANNNTNRTYIQSSLDFSFLLVFICVLIVLFVCFDCFCDFSELESSSSINWWYVSWF